jgi:hypothetical protein
MMKLAVLALGVSTSNSQPRNGPNTNAVKKVGRAGSVPKGSMREFHHPVTPLIMYSEKCTAHSKEKREAG